MGLNFGKMKKYSLNIDKEIDNKLNGGGGVMGRLKRIMDKGILPNTGNNF